jgi:predicted acylesterase/phospholipase RssA
MNQARRGAAALALLVSMTSCKLTGQLPYYREANRARPADAKPYQVRRGWLDPEALSGRQIQNQDFVSDSMGYVIDLATAWLPPDLAERNEEKLEIATGGSFYRDESWRTLHQDPFPEVEVVVALSGGGMRAANLAGAVMLEMSQVPLTDREGREITLLDAVDTLSSVSGGSFAAAFYLYHRSVFRQNLDEGKAAFHRDLLQAGLRENFQQRLINSLFVPYKVFTLIRTFTRANRTTLYSNLIEYRLVRPQRLETLQAKVLPRSWRRSKVLSASADFLLDLLWALSPLTPDDQYLFRRRGRTFDDLYLQDPAEPSALYPLRPEWVINATSFNEPVERNAFLFDEQSFNRYRSDWLAFRVSDAVAASAAFPVLFAPLSWRDWSAETPNWLFLFDGGVADNQGINGVRRALTRVPPSAGAVVILVDASPRQGQIVSENADRPGSLSVSNRAVDRYMASARRQSIASLREAETNGELKLFHLSIRPEEFGDGPLEPEALARFEAANRIETGLKISREEQDTLFEVGRILVERDRNAILRAITTGLAPAGSGDAASP